VAERREPSRQTALTHGRRRTDPILTTADCARRINVSPEFIVRQIKDGYLEAYTFVSGGRTLYRISEDAWQAYLEGRTVRRSSEPEATT
jgi:excisionase family DNA binding protein